MSYTPVYWNQVLKDCEDPGYCSAVIILHCKSNALGESYTISLVTWPHNPPGANLLRLSLVVVRVFQVVGSGLMSRVPLMIEN